MDQHSKKELKIINENALLKDIEDTLRKTQERKIAFENLAKALNSQQKASIEKL